MKRTNKTVLWSVVSALLLSAILCGILTNGFLDFNRFCWFGHDYGEDNVCVRCGADKPIENGDGQPQAVITEKYVFASTDTLNASYSANAVLGGTPVAVGDNVDTVDYFLVDLSNMSIEQDLNCQKLFSVGNATYYLFVQDVYNSGNSKWEPKWGLYPYYLDAPSAPDSAYMGVIPNSKIVTFKANILADIEHHSGTVTELGDFTVNKVLDRTPLPQPPTKTGYTFTGWYTDAACTNKYTEDYVTGDLTLYAGFRAHTYSIKFNANSGSGTMATMSMTYDQSKSITANAFTKEHFAFKGWATSVNGSVVYSNGQSVKNLTATDGAVIELFAVWERAEVQVDFVVEGQTTTMWVAIGSNARLPERPEKEGHIFAGWFFADGAEYVDQNLTEDTTLTAKFNIILCTVTFIVDGEVYATYVCDWGTPLADALKANNVNPVLLKTEDEYSRNF